MDAWNTQLFLWLAGGWQPTPWVLALARWWALYGALISAILLAWLVWRRPQARMYVLGSLLACVVSILLAHRIGVWLGHPRPFVLGISPAYIPHAARGSLPSVHASALFTIAFCGLLWPSARSAGVLALFVALLVSWARVYCGVHFPFDIAAGALLGGAIAILYRSLWRGIRRYRQVLSRSVLPGADLPVQSRV